MAALAPGGALPADTEPKKMAEKTSDSFTSSSNDDFEMHAFAKHERQNWNLKLGDAKWGLRINPVSFFGSVLVIWGFAIWCMVKSEEAKIELDGVQRWVTDTMTWAYIATQQIWIVFIVILYFSPLGKLKLGKPNDEPEYPAASWFMMMFSAGIGIGLFFFGVAEPVWHYEPCYGAPFAGVDSECVNNRFANLPDNERAQWAINLTYFHWGIHGWIAYCVVGLLLGTVVYRRDFPMTMKSAFYPVIGDKIFGWMGDAIDTVSVAATLFGVCTSLGLGAIQLNAGLNRVNDEIATSFTNQAIIIASVTLLATISVVTGVKVGIRRLSEINFILAQILLFVFFFQDDTWYLLNSIVQSLGFYIQWFVQLGNWCNTWENAPEETVGGVHVTAVAPDMIERVPLDPETGTRPSIEESRDWMNDWTMFYWGWWIAWAPFVGIFIAKISRGRTVRQIINGALTGPVFYGFIWFGIFGSIGLRIERQAANLMPPLTCDDVSREIDDRLWTRLSCRGSEEQWFDMVANFPMRNFYWVVSIISLVLYFVTSSDSGSLVIDCLTSNGNPHPPVFQRIFWSFTEGAVAIALLKVGGPDALSALRAVNIVAGVPYTVVVCLMCKGLWDLLSEEHAAEHGKIMHEYREWATGLVDVLDYPTFSVPQLIKTLTAVFLPFLYSGKGASGTLGGDARIWQAIYGLLFITFPVLCAAEPGQRGLWAIGFTSYVLYAVHTAYVRSDMRHKRNIKGNIFTDLLVCFLFYPFAAVQLADEVDAADGEDMNITNVAQI